MFTKTTFAAAAFAALASAQTFTDCNPLEKTCKPNPGFGNKKVECDFTQGPCDVFHPLDGTEIEYTDKGAVFSISKGTEAPTIMTTGHIFFGRLDVEVEPAPGTAIITSIVLQSDDLDEMDWEWLGGDKDQVQTNYFSKGDTTTYDRGQYHQVSAAIGSTHTYSIEWTAEKAVWMVNGEVVRTLTYAETKSKFPQTPSNIRIGTWCAGTKNTPEGTREWAGGFTDFSKGPFNAYYKSIKITDYAGGNKAASFPVKEYVYGDKTGDWESIKVVKGDGTSSDNEKVTSAISKLPKPTNLVKDDKSDFEEKTKSKSAEVETTIEYKPSSTKSSKSEEKDEETSTVSTPSAKKTSSEAETTTESESDSATSTSSSESSSNGAAGAEETSTEVPESAAGSHRAAVGAVAAAGLFALFA